MKITFALIATLALQACATVNPIAQATDLEQRAYALYGVFVIVEEQGGAIVQSANTPARIKAGIQLADAKAKPTADTLVIMLQQYQTALATVKTGNTPSAQLTIATNSLSQWIQQAQTDVGNLVTAVHTSP